MSSLSRICVAAALIVLSLVTVRAAVAPQDLEQQKQLVVRTSLEKLGRYEMPGGLMDAAARAKALAAITISGTPEMPEILLTTSGRPTYRTFTLEAGRVVVIDLVDTVNIGAEKALAPADTALVQDVRSSMFSFEPRLTSRVVITLNEPIPYTVAQIDGQVTVSFNSKESAPEIISSVERIARLNESLGQLEREEQTDAAVSEFALALSAVRGQAPATVAVPVYLPEQNLRSRDVLASLLAVVEPVPLTESEAVPLHVAQTSDAHQPPAQPPAAPAEPAPAAPAAPAPAPTDQAAPADPAASPPPPEKRNAEEVNKPPVKMKQIMTENVPAPPPEAITPAASAQPIKKASEKPAELMPVLPNNALEQIVNIDFREMELANVVALLAQKANMNVIAGQDLKGIVTANLKQVTLRRAMETVLRMNGLGMVDEEGIFHIIPYEEAMAAQRIKQTVKLEHSKAADVRKTLEEILKGSPDDTLMAVSVNDKTNMLIIAGPKERVAEFANIANELDIAEPVTPTVTEAIKLNNAEPKDIVAIVTSMLTPEIGKAAIDETSRHLIVTDVPVVIEQVRQLLTQVDIPVRQVFIDAMIVDAVLGDNAETGVDWFINSVQHLNKRGQIIGSLSKLGLETDATANPVTPNIIGPVPMTGRLLMGVLTNNIDIRGVIGMEVRNERAKLLANPVITTVENKKAKINISQEIPYQEFTQSLTGPPMATTNFKDIGIVLEVLPRVTHDDFIIADLSAKQSDAKGVVNNIPVEDKRETETTLRMKNGQTIFIGGLRRFDNAKEVRKIPILGNIPVMNVMFRHNIVSKESTELLIFLTCSVLPDNAEPLSPEMQAAHDQLDHVDKVPRVEGELGRETLHPNRPYEDPFWKWRRSE